MWNQAAVYRRRRRTFAAGVLLLIVLIIVITSTGGGKLSPPSHPASAGTTSLPQSPAPLTYTRASSLSEPVRASAAALMPGGKAAFSLLGGLDSSDNGTSGIGKITSNSTTVVGYLPVSLFAAAAVTLGDHEYIFGGATGSAKTPVPEKGILSYDPLSSNATVTEIAHLPSNNYGLGAAAIGSTVYIVGGDDGSATLDTIVSWRLGGTATVAKRLPLALRYAAVAAVDGRVVIAGGLLADNTASKAVYVYDPTTQRITRLKAQLPTGIYAAAGASLGALVYVIGGATPTGPASNPTATPVNTIYSVDPITGKLALAGTIGDGARAEGAAVTVGKVIYLAGGLTGTQTTAAVGALTTSGGAG